MIEWMRDVILLLTGAAFAAAAGGGFLAGTMDGRPLKLPVRWLHWKFGVHSGDRFLADRFTFSLVREKYPALFANRQKSLTH